MPSKGGRLRNLKPTSRAFTRGVISDRIDGRSREGKLARAMEYDLRQHIGGNPNVMQKLLIERMIKIRLQLDLLDEKLEAGEFTDYDRRVYGALLNAFRLTAREIGIKPAAAGGRAPASLRDYVAAKAAGEAAQ